MNTHFTELERITGVLLKSEDDFGELRRVVDDFYQLCIDISELTHDASENREDVYLAQGKAIGPIWAAMCMKEMLRTKRFIQGLARGIRSAMKRFPHTRIHILYAGTGPFATLALPLTTVFTSEEICFTFLEVNLQSIRILQKMISAFAAERYIVDVVHCDATDYKVNPDTPVHLLITETMQNALQKEPHVGITLNLVSQIEQEAVLIPENIIIEAALLHPQKEMERMSSREKEPTLPYLSLGSIFELNHSTASQYHTMGSFPVVEVDFPDNLPEGYHRLCLLTTIQICEEIQLTYQQSSLNIPQKLIDLERENRSIRNMSFQYILNKQPGFVFHCE